MKDEDVFDHTMKVLDASRNTPEMDYAGELEVMFAALFHDAGKPRTVGYSDEKDQVTFYGHQIVSKHIVRKWMKKYRVEMIGVEPTVVTNLVENHMFETKSFFSDKSLRRFIRKVGPDQIVRLLDLRIADKKGGRFPNKLHEIVKLKTRVIEELNKKPPFGPKDLAITGHDLMALGIPAGPHMGEIIKAAVDLVVDNPEFNTKDYLLQWIKDHYLGDVMRPLPKQRSHDARAEGK
jgi:tRNA nucleotidyltransferase (CCA-adding enzyme)